VVTRLQVFEFFGNDGHLRSKQLLPMEFVIRMVSVIKPWYRSELSPADLQKTSLRTIFYCRGNPTGVACCKR